MKALLYSFVLLAASFVALGQPGTIDPTFNPGSGANNEYVRRIIVQPDGKILVAGAFTQFNGVNKPYLVRLNADGSLDETFNLGSGFNAGIGDIGLQNDGKIVVGGSFTSFNGTAAERILRLNPDGSRDGSFSIGLGPNGSVGCLLVTPEQKVYISGNFSMFNGIQRLRIARLSSNGTLDTSFDPQGGLNGLAYSMALQTDNKLVVGGNFTSYNDIPVGRLVRILPTGQADASFNPGTAVSNINQNINTISLQEDGKIIVAGLFTSFNNQAVKHIVRLMPDGQLDATFNPPVFSDQIESVVSLPNGKIAVVGRFTSASSIARNRVAGLNSDGSMDMNFNPGTGASAITYDIKPYGINKLMIGGYFTTYNVTSRGRIARINAESFTSAYEPLETTRLGNCVWRSNEQSLEIVPFNDEEYTASIIDSAGRLILKQNLSGKTLLSLSWLEPGVYHVSLQGKIERQSTRIIKN